MNNNKSIKNVIIVILCITIITMGIGFIFISIKLDNYRNETDFFDVRFKKVKQLSSIKGGDKEPSGKIKIDKTGKIIDINFQLFNEHDEMNYEVTIKNEGTLDASIVKLFSSPDFNSKKVIKEISPVFISVSDMNGKILEPGEETTVKISAIYNPEKNQLETAKPINVTGKIGIITQSSHE